MEDAFIFSDPHGYLDELIRLFELNGLTDSNGKWIGGNRRLICLGDYVDRGPKSVELYRYLRSLQNELGPDQVEMLLGNHDIQYIGGPDGGWDQKVANGLMKELRTDALAGHTKFATTVEAEGKDWLCVHAGLHPGYEEFTDLSAQETAERLNALGMDFAKDNVQHPEIVGVGIERTSDRVHLDKAIRETLLAADIDQIDRISIYSMPPLRALKIIEERGLAKDPMIYSTQGFEMLGVIEKPGITWCDAIDDLSRRKDVRPQIVGHRQMPQGIRNMCDGNLWAVNVPYGEMQGLKINANDGAPSFEPTPRIVNKMGQETLMYPDDPNLSRLGLN